MPTKEVEDRIAWTGEGMEDSHREYVSPTTGEILPSVTTILSPYFDPSMVYSAWIAEEVERLKDIYLNGGHAYTFVQEDGGSTWERVECNPLDLLLDGSYISKAGHRRLGRRRDTGTLRHCFLNDLLCGMAPDDSQVEEWAAGKCADWQLNTEPFEWVLPQLQLLTRWVEENGVVAEALEKPMYGDMFAGTPDMHHVALTKGPDKGMEVVVADLKPEQITRSHLAQCGAYAELAGGGPTLIINVGDKRIGHRYVTAKETKAYYEQLFIPALAMYLNKKAIKLPEAKTKWIK